MKSIKRVVTRDEASQILRVDKSTVSRLAKSKQIACFHIGSRLLFRYDDIVMFIDKQIAEGIEKSREDC